MKTTITMLGKKEIISGEKLYLYLYKSLKWSDKMKKDINRNNLKKHVTSKELFYHPLWIAKTLIIAERFPFPPKKIPRMIFVDAISGYRGMLSTVPHTTEVKLEKSQMIKNRITEEQVHKYIKDVQEKQINRSYILKKPKHRMIELTLVYLPLWRVNVHSDIIKKEFIINANTGESEEYMVRFYEKNKQMYIS